MGTRRIRNKCCVPFLNKEGTFVKNIIPAKYIGREIKCEEIPAPERLHAHQTLASARRFAGFKQFSDLVPKDQLDFVLTSGFDHTYQSFPCKTDVYKQPESMGIDTWRRLRNTRDLILDREHLAAGEELDPKRKRKIPFKYNWAHKVMIGGVLEKKHASSVKLMNSSHHSPQTNAGYSRQESDGNPYQY